MALGWNLLLCRMSGKQSILELHFQLCCFKTARVYSSQNTRYNGNFGIYLIIWSKAGKKVGTYQLQPVLQLLHSELNRCCKQTSGTGPPGHRVSQSIPVWMNRKTGWEEWAFQEQGTNLSKNTVSIPSQQLALPWRVTPKFNSAVWHTVT